MALREEEVMRSTAFQESESEEGSESAYENWFWRPVKRHQTDFLKSCGEETAWREAGRRLQIAHRFSSHVGSKQARLAYMYDRLSDRDESPGDAMNQKKERTTW